MKSIRFLLLVIILFSNCKKDGPQSFYLTDNEKKFIGFKLGSYWVFQNDSTSALDSLYLNSNYSGSNSFQSNGQTVLTNEVVNCTINSSIDSSFSIEKNMETKEVNLASFKIKFRYCCDSINVPWTIDPTVSETNGIVQFYYPEKIPISPISQLILNGTTYNNVTHLKKSNINGTSTQKDILTAEIYEVQGVGLIKWKIVYTDNSSETWSLLRSNIVF